MADRQQTGRALLNPGMAGNNGELNGEGFKQYRS